MTKGLIVGFDPGTCIGLAVLDTRGNILTVLSKKEMGRNDIIRFITKFGQPLIVASDVNPPPKSVERIGSVLHCKVYSPEFSLRVNEKQEMIEEFSDIKMDEHEIDALAAAIKAWKNYRPFFSKVENSLQKLGLSEFFEDVIIKLLKERSDNIDDAINEILAERRRMLPEMRIEAKEDQKEVIQRLRKDIAQKNRHAESLKRQAEILSESLNRTKKRLKLFERVEFDFKELKKIKKSFEEVKKANEFLKSLARVEDKKLIPLVYLEKIDNLAYTDNLIDLENRFVFTNSMENLNLLNQYKIKGLVTTTVPNKKILEDLEFPVVSIKEDQIQNINEIKVVKIEDLEKELSQAKKAGLVGWLEKYRKREH